jgi:flagellar hook protein FlgE
MSFNTSLSGLNAASSDLSVTSNNIANVGSTGFKGSRAEFADIYANNSFGASNTAVGSGARVAAVRQKFTQGNLEFTNSSLDLAIAGRGFFVTAQDVTGGDALYTRAGAFGVDRNGFVANSSGHYLQVFPTAVDGTVTSTSLSSAHSVQLPETFGAPQATTRVELGFNLPAEAAVPANNPFVATDATTYNHSTSVTLYDSLGTSHIAQIYFIKQPNTALVSNLWETRTVVNGTTLTPTPPPPALPGPQTLQFDSTGSLVAPATGQIAYNPLSLNSGAAALNLTFDYSTGTTQFSSPFTPSSVSQDGNTTGLLTGLDISDDGTVRANYNNGQTPALGKIAMADFANPEALQQAGNTAWRETTDSGLALTGEAGSGRFGEIRGGALETSNVELTEQLVKLITAQRNFQANAKAIETSNTLTQTIINI